MDTPFRGIPQIRGASSEFEDLRGSLRHVDVVALGGVDLRPDPRLFVGPLPALLLEDLSQDARVG